MRQELARPSHRPPSSQRPRRLSAAAGRYRSAQPGRRSIEGLPISSRGRIRTGPARRSTRRPGKPSASPRVFISYARRDGARFATALRKKLLSRSSRSGTTLLPSQAGGIGGPRSRKRSGRRSWSISFCWSRRQRWRAPLCAKKFVWRGRRARRCLLSGDQSRRS
jgi:hypothetical protein